MIKIGIDTQSIKGKKTGIGYYTNNLIQNIKRSNNFSFNFYMDEKKEELDTLGRMFWENVTLPYRAGHDKLDILHIPGFAGPLVKGKYKKIVTVHDLIGMIFPQNLGFVSRFYWQKWLPQCVKNSDFIIADSENTKNDIMKFLNISPNKIKVVYLAVDEIYKPLKDLSGKDVLRKYGIDRKYILNVGTIEPRKNITNLIAAFNLYLKHATEDFLLVIAGKKGWDYQKCYCKVKELGLQDKVIFCDYVHEKDLPVLYSLAEVFIYPSFYEGFGLPVLEAMNCATPVISSCISSLPEITGDAAVLVEPDSIESINSALLKTLGDKLLLKELSAKSFEQSKKFSWEKVSKLTLETYAEVVNLIA